MCTISISDKGRHTRRSTQKQCWWVWNLSRKTISNHCSLRQKSWLPPFPRSKHIPPLFLYQYLLSFCSSFHKWVVKKEEFCLFLLWQPLACVKHSHQPSCRAVPAGLCPGQRCRWQQSAGFWPVPLAPPRQAEDQPNFGCPPPGTQRAQW